MARRGKQLTKAERAQRRRQRENEDLSNVVTDMAARFTCMVEVARDFAGQCDESMVHLDFDLSCAELALEFWAGHPGRPEQVLELLTELAAERRRHREATAALAARLTAFADEAHLTESGHVHLKPIEAYRARIRQRLYPDL